MVLHRAGSSSKCSSEIAAAAGDILWHTVSRDILRRSEDDIESFHSAGSLRSDLSEKHRLVQPSKEVDDVEKCLPSKGVSWTGTAFLIINAALGIGILNFPAAYNQAGGIISATIIQMVLMSLMITTMLILAYCSDFNSDTNYHDVILTMCGRRAQQLAAVSITCTLYCVCVGIFVVIGDQIDSLFHSVFGPRFCNHWYLRRTFTIPASAVCLVLPLCYSKRADFLRYVGSIGIFAILYPVFLTVYGYVEMDLKPENIKYYPDNLSEMFAVIPVLGLGYQSQEVVIPIYACMKERNLCNFTKSSFLAMGFLFVLYSIIGSCGYLTFGSNVAHNVMKMYAVEDPVVMVGVVALIVKMIVTYPILALCGREAVAGLYAELVGLSASKFEKSEFPRRIVVSSLWFGTSLVLALSASGIGIVIKYMGSVACANIFIYPGICLMKVAVKEDPSYETWRCRFMLLLAIGIIAFGAFCIGVVLLQTILSSNKDTPISYCM